MEMTLKLNTTGQTVILDEADQALVCLFYRKHLLIERLINYAEENNLPRMRFKSDAALDTVVNRILIIKDTCNISEDEAINQVITDKNYMEHYTLD